LTPLKQILRSMDLRVADVSLPEGSDAECSAGIVTVEVKTSSGLAKTRADFEEAFIKAAKEKSKAAIGLAEDILLNKALGNTSEKNTTNGFTGTNDGRAPVIQRLAARILQRIAANGEKPTSDSIHAAICQSELLAELGVATNVVAERASCMIEREFGGKIDVNTIARALHEAIRDTTIGGTNGYEDME